MRTIVWLREDLRLLDNPALYNAAAQGQLLPVFIYPTDLGAASYWWLHQSLLSLTKALSERGVQLILRTGEPAKVLLALCEQTKADQVVWNRVYSPKGMADGAAVKQALSNQQLKFASYNGQLLLEPSKIFNKQGTPFKVFTPFWRHCLSVLDPSPTLPIPKLQSIEHQVASEPLESWGLQPTQPDWSGGLSSRWQPGEAGAQSRWQLFFEQIISSYKDGRDFPAQHNTSYLSPHLAFGEISPKQIWFDVQQGIATQQVDAFNANKFVAEIGWREYSRYLLVHFPHVLSEPFNPRFENFPWQNNASLLQAWQQGQTGYPIVDAGMRELWATGYMHNRVRMVVASFLTKHCLIHWQEGAAWFWDTLVDADIANNTASWQWVSGCGADAAPYFRIFNPVLQGEKFDKQGDYVRQWLPELSKVPKKFIHSPWLADPMTLQLANVTLGKDYPHPVVDHKQARQMALDSYQALKAMHAEQ